MRLGEDGMTTTGRWMQKHVWGERSAVATRITDVCDALGLPYVVKVLGTGNFFSDDVARLCAQAKPPWGGGR